MKLSNKTKGFICIVFLLNPPAKDKTKQNIYDCHWLLALLDCVLQGSMGISDKLLLEVVSLDPNVCIFTP